MLNARSVGFDSLPTPKQLKSMTLLQNVIKEALRLHTPRKPHLPIPKGFR